MLGFQGGGVIKGMCMMPDGNTTVSSVAHDAGRVIFSIERGTISIFY